MDKIKFNGTFAYKTDIGRVRSHNDDNCKVAVNGSGNIFLVLADGMGGQNKGDYASLTAVNYLINAFLNKNKFHSTLDAKIWLAKNLQKINSILFNTQENDENFKGMGTTLVIALIVDFKILILNIGDSRCYFLKNHELIQKTSDQTYVNFLYKSGQIEEKDMETDPNRHVLTNSLGTFPSVSYDLNVYKYEGEMVFLCSDGLYNNVAKKDIESLLNTNDDPNMKVESLIALANYNGGSDNISCCLWETFKHD